MAANKNKLPGALAPSGLKARLLALAFAALLSACGDKTPQGPAAGGAPPPPEVGVVTVKTGPVGLTVELPGRLEASRVAQVRARVRPGTRARQTDRGRLQDGRGDQGRRLTLDLERELVRTARVERESMPCRAHGTREGLDVLEERAPVEPDAEGGGAERLAAAVRVG